jgi:hypothetical protein
MNQGTVITIGVNVLIDAIAAMLRAKQAAAMDDAEREAFIAELQALSEQAVAKAGDEWQAVE